MNNVDEDEALFYENRIYNLFPKDKVKRCNRTHRLAMFERSTRASITRHSILISKIYIAYMNLPVPHICTPSCLTHDFHYSMTVRILFCPAETISKDNSYCYHCKEYTVLNCIEPFDPHHKPNWFWIWNWSLPKGLQNPKFLYDDYDYDPWAPSVGDFPNSEDDHDDSRYEAELSQDNLDSIRIHPPPQPPTLSTLASKRVYDFAFSRPDISNSDDDDSQSLDNSLDSVPPTQKRARILVPSSQTPPPSPTY